MFAEKMLPIPEGQTFGTWCTTWLQDIKSDLYSIIPNDGNAVRQRNERFASYLPTISTLRYVYRGKIRLQIDLFNIENPKPERGVTEHNARRDSHTAELRYTLEYLEQLHGDVERRISVAQSDLSFTRAEMQTASAMGG